MTTPGPWYLSATSVAAVPWLVRVRSITALLSVVVVAIAVAWPAADFPLRHAVLLIAAAGLAHAGIAVALIRQWRLPVPVLIGALLLDVVLLGWLLDLTGGPFNPFAVILLVQVALAGVTLGRMAAGIVGVAAALSYGVLLYLHTIEGVAGHHRLNDFPTHLFTMWVAVAAMAELAAYVAVQASTAVEAMRQRATRSERLVSLTTLAAGAAHELSTPLATIAVAARELERAAGHGVPAADLADDARLIRTEVDRCQAILDSMSGRAGGTIDHAPEPVAIDAALADAARALPAGHGARVRIDTEAALPPVHASRAAFRQALTSLLTNALDASPATSHVDVTARAVASPAGVRITVRDHGQGMAPEVLARAGEPFFTTREAGRGMGLGLFLARVFAERSGGALSIHSGDGTTVTLDLPLGAPGLERP